MNDTLLIVPGYHGSGPGHWQSWLQGQLPAARRLDGVDWEAPQLNVWSGRLGEMIENATGRVWLVAHSFGCLVAVHAALAREDRVAGALLVAPADPERFGDPGLRVESDQGPSISPLLPQTPLTIPTILVASSNDPWLRITRAVYLAERWGSHFVDLGPAGHINAEAGFGPWPAGLRWLETLRQTALPLVGGLELAHPVK